jgi:hypothetical protein
MFRRPCPDGVSGYGVNGRKVFQENAMTALNRRSLLLGLSAVGASALVSRAYAQAPAGPFKLDPLPYAAN